MAEKRRARSVLLQLWFWGAAMFAASAALGFLAWRVANVAWDHAFLGTLGLCSVGVIWLISWYRGRLEASDRSALQESIAKRLHQPASLYPSIDPDLCIGSLSCLTVCPEGDILGVVDGKATLINASACIGHGQCYLECPVDAIQLVMGTSQRGVDLPEVDEHFESARPGVFIIGELGGMGLIKNAMAQGLQLGKHLAEVLEPSADPDVVDVAIVGAGPAGIAAALSCQAQGLSHRIFEQDTLGGTVFSYPRQKVVMMEPIHLPGYGRFGNKLVSKEALLEAFSTAARKNKLRIDEKTQVTGIEGESGAFRVITQRGAVNAQRVALAIGRRGTPRKMGAKGEDLEKVTYRLLDPEQYDGARVLVVGGGDSALEAAIQLVEQSDAEVWLSYRNPEFGKARDANKRKIREHADGGRLQLLMSSVVREVKPDEVVLTVEGREVTLPNDFVIVCIGGELPTDFLAAVGVRLQRVYGTALGEETERSSPGVRRGSAKQDAEREGQRQLALSLYSIGLLIVATLVVIGWDYYRLPREERVWSSMHETMRPSGPWGHGIGIVATLFMLSNFIYVVRKRWSRLKGIGHIRKWLTVHQFVGYMSGSVIGFHAAFQSNNLLATCTAAAVGIVIGTGILGRYVFGIVSGTGGRAPELADVMGRWERYRSRIDRFAELVGQERWARDAIEWVSTPRSGHSFARALVAQPFDRLRAVLVLRRLRDLFLDDEQFDDFQAAFRRLVELRLHVAFFSSLKRFLRMWRLWHVSMAVFLVLLITAHIAMSLHLGFRWIF